MRQKNVIAAVALVVAVVIAGIVVFAIVRQGGRPGGHDGPVHRHPENTPTYETHGERDAPDHHQTAAASDPAPSEE